jgi:hypothetical protein
VKPPRTSASVLICVVGAVLVVESIWMALKAHRPSYDIFIALVAGVLMLAVGLRR